MSVAVHKRNVRDALEPRREPYWSAPIEPGRFVGFRKIDVQRGSWIARARNDDGKQEYKALKDAADHDAALKAARDWFANLDAGVNTKGSFTVADACTEYVEELERAKRDKTAADAKWRFERGGIRSGTFGATEVSKLRAPALKKWRDSLVTEDDEGRQMTKAGANRMMTTMRAALNLAVDNNRVAATAAQAWRTVKQYPKADGRREVFLDLTQRRALLAAAAGSLSDLIQAALLTGGRPGELVSATRAQFDARTKTIRLNGKTGPRDVPLMGGALTLFERLAKSKLPAALLLTRGDGQPWTRIEWSRQIRAASEAAELKDDMDHVLKDEKGNPLKLPPGVCLYSCRHTHITQSLMDGLTTLDVAQLTGTSLMMIERHYGQYVQGAVRERLAKVRML